jgi:hypothetical protein
MDQDWKQWDKVSLLVKYGDSGNLGKWLCLSSRNFRLCRQHTLCMET